MTYYSITTASNENTQNPDAERVERRRPDGGGWTRPLGHRSNDRIPPRRLATTENERTPIDANETRQKNSTLPTPRSISFSIGTRTNRTGIDTARTRSSCARRRRRWWRSRTRTHRGRTRSFRRTYRTP